MQGQAYMQHWTLIRQVLQDHIELDKVRYSQHAGERMEQLNGILHSCDPITRVLVVYSMDYEPVRIRLQDIFSITTI